MKIIQKNPLNLTIQNLTPLRKELVVYTNIDGLFTVPDKKGTVMVGVRDLVAVVATTFHSPNCFQVRQKLRLRK